VSAPLPVLALQGTARQQGQQHGEALREAVCHNVHLYLHRFQTDGQLPAAEVERRAAAYLEVFRREDPDYTEAMAGISEGSGRTLLEVAMLNARYEILYSAYSAIGVAEARGGCTAFAATREATADGHLWIGQTWDWIPGVRGALLRTEEGGLQTLTFTEAGIVGGKIGFNSAGVGLVINGLLSHLDDWSRLGTPFHLRTSRILRSRTLSEAVAHATSGTHGCSANFLVGQGGSGESVVDIETSPAGCTAIPPSGGLLAHANHFLRADALGIWQPLREERRSTYLRCRRMEDLLQEYGRQGPLALEDLKAILRDHEGYPDSVCRHPNPQLPEEERLETVFAALMDLDGLVMHYTAGPPCTAAWHTERLR
jgi:isopenicillin-N N-acyltransferase-like protein